MPCDCKKKKTYLRIYSGNKEASSDVLSPKFFLNQNIENITGFQVAEFYIRYTDAGSQTLKIQSRELSNLTTDKIQGTYNGSTMTIHEIQTQYSFPNEPRQLWASPIYNVSNGNLSVISFDFKEMDGTTDASNFQELFDFWSMLIVFYH